MNEQYLVNHDNVVASYNACKEALLDRLYLDGIISKETHEGYSTKWAIVMLKKKWHEKWWDKFCGNTNNEDFVIRIVKLED